MRTKGYNRRRNMLANYMQEVNRPYEKIRLGNIPRDSLWTRLVKSYGLGWPLIKINQTTKGYEVFRQPGKLAFLKINDTEK